MIPRSVLALLHRTLPAPLRLTALATMVALTARAHAAPIVTDGGFESAGGGNTYFGPYPGNPGQSIDGGAWTVTSGAVYIDTQDPFVYDGNNSLNLTGANPYVTNTISQILNTLPGFTYQVNFFANADSANTFALFANGVRVSGSPTSIAANGFPGLVTNSSLFTSYSGSFVANSSTTTFNISGVSSPTLSSQTGSVVLDDLNVATTPEPSSIMLLVTGVAGLGEVLRRRRTAGDLAAS